MHQASILMTFFVCLAGAAWLGLESGVFDEQLGRTPAEASATAAEQPAVQPEA